MKRFLAIGIVAVVVAVAALLLLRYGGVAEALVGAAWRARDGGSVGIALYGVVLALATAAFVPQLALTVPAGYSYGAVVGFCVAYPASFAASVLAFALGRSLLRTRLERRFRADPRVRKLDAAVRARGVLVIVLVRLSPVFPFAVVNYMLSLTSVRWRQYLIGSAIGLVPVVLIYVYLGSIATDAVALLRGRFGA